MSMSKKEKRLTTAQYVKMLKGARPEALCDTTEMSEEEWLEMRKHGPSWGDPFAEEYIPTIIGGSSTAKVLGVSEYGETFEEWYNAILGEKVEVFESEGLKETFTSGHVFEPFVAINFMRYMKKFFPEAKVRLIKDIFRDVRGWITSEHLKGSKAVDTAIKAGLDGICAAQVDEWGINPNTFYQCGYRNEDGTLRYPFACGNLDGLVSVAGKVGIFEAKTTSSIDAQKRYWKLGICPPWYETQVRYYMAIMNVDFAYITCCWGYTLNDMAVIRVDRDLEVELDMMERIKYIVDSINSLTPYEELDLTEYEENPVKTADYYIRKYGVPDTRKPVAEIPEKYRLLVSQARAIAAQKKSLLEALASVEASEVDVFNQLLPLYDGSEYGNFRLDDETVLGIKLVTPSTKAGFDKEAFKADDPEEYEKYCTRETVEKETFDGAKLKRKDAVRYAKYYKPGMPKPREEWGKSKPSFTITEREIPREKEEE